MNLQPVVVYGAGGHGKVIIDILELDGRFRILGLVDDDPARCGTLFCGHRVLGGLSALRSMNQDGLALVLAIGDNSVRRRIAERLSGFTFARAIHPTATLARDVQVGVGTVIMAHAVVNSGTSVGNHAIINTGAIVDHDCSVGDFAHLSPGVKLGGHVAIGDGAHIGIGASVINDVAIGCRTTIGAGAAVVEDIPEGVLAVGVPARVVRSIDETTHE